MNPGWKQDDDRTSTYFRELLRAHAGTSQAVDWGSEESQHRRFAALLGPLGLDGASILDVGCGQGDLLAFLQANGVEARYEGVDLTEEMVRHCRERFPGTTFHQASVLDLPLQFKGQFDYVVASGLFFLRQSDPMAFLEQSVNAMFDCCRVGVSFNSLSAWGRPPADGEFAADPLDTLRIARACSSRIVFRHDYHPGDFTITVMRDSEAS